VAFMQRVISGAAAEGNSVIVGRGAPFFLRDRADAFHVFVYAPIEEKVRRLCGAGKSEACALEEIASVDRQRVIFVRRYFDMDWPTRELYHLMINSKVGDDVVIDTILSEIDRVGGLPVQSAKGVERPTWL
jgi:cytidylate kinase